MKNKPTVFKTPLKSAEDWKVRLEVDNGEVYYVPNYDTPEKKLQRYNITDSLEKDAMGSTKNRLLFGSGNCELTIINSLQVDQESTLGTFSSLSIH